MSSSSPPASRRTPSCRPFAQLRQASGPAPCGPASCLSSKLKDPIPNLIPIFQPNHQTLEGSFSSASKPIFASKYAYCSTFRGLQDLQSFAPLQFPKLSKISGRVFGFLLKILQQFCIFQRFSSNFAQILINTSRNFAEYFKE